MSWKLPNQSVLDNQQQISIHRDNTKALVGKSCDAFGRGDREWIADDTSKRSGSENRERRIVVDGSVSMVHHRMIQTLPRLAIHSRE